MTDRLALGLICDIKCVFLSSNLLLSLFCWIPRVSSLLQLPSGRLLYDPFLFFFNEDSFPLADQQLMDHLDTTNATRPPFKQEAVKAASLSLSLLLTVSHTQLLSSHSWAFEHVMEFFFFSFAAVIYSVRLSSCSAFTETSSRKTSSSQNTRSSNSVTLGLPGFSVSFELIQHHLVDSAGCTSDVHSVVFWGLSLKWCFDVITLILLSLYW